MDSLLSASTATAGDVEGRSDGAVAVDSDVVAGVCGAVAWNPFPAVATTADCAEARVCAEGTWSLQPPMPKPSISDTPSAMAR